MRRKVIFPITALLVFTLCWSLSSWGESSCRDMPGWLSVKFKSGVLTNYSLERSRSLSTGIASFDQLNERYNVMEIRKVFPEEISVPPPGSGLLDMSGFYVVEFPEGSDLQELIAVYSQDPNIEIVETIKICPMDKVPDDPLSQWHIYNALGNDADVDAYEGWDLETGDSTIILAILDSGVGYYCPDLAGNMWTNPGEIPNNSIDDDLNGYVDDYLGWDFVNNTTDCNTGEDCSVADNDPRDFDGHGTHVAGIAAAVTNNSTEVAGIAGGWYPEKGCKIMALRIGWAASGAPAVPGYISMIYAAQAINYARIKGAKAINCSWSSGEYAPLYTAINNAINQGIVFCKSSGNDNIDFADWMEDTFPEVLVVSATDRYDQKASFSNFGNWVDISAPGDDIRSTYGWYYGCGTAKLGGTSMASPMVTGLVGLIRSKVPSLTIEQVTSLIEDNADSIDYLNPGYEGKLGAGRISLYRSLLPLPNANFSADVILGQAPLTVNFTGSSSGDSLYNWKWDYGDGDSASYDTLTVPPFHTYTDPGVYNCSFSVTGAWGTNTETIIIGATADTVVASSAEGSAGEYGVKVPLYANNTLTVSQMIITMRYGDGTAPLDCDSVRFWGTRVEDFPIKNVSVHKGYQTIVLTLKNTSDPLEPGSGLIANMYFKLDPTALVGDTIQIDTSIVGDNYLKYSSILGDYTPDFQVGSIYVVEPLWGDADRDDEITVADVIFLINYLFKGGPAPNPLNIGDANCVEDITVADPVYIINYLFKGGPKPDC